MKQYIYAREDRQAERQIDDRSSLKEFTFEPTEEFSILIEDESGNRDVLGQYVSGNSYNCSRQPVHDFLREKCAEIEEAGSINVYYLPTGKNFVITSVQEAK